jgi:hypothetical protein
MSFAIVEPVVSKTFVVCKSDKEKSRGIEDC